MVFHDFHQTSWWAREGKGANYAAFCVPLILRYDLVKLRLYPRTDPLIWRLRICQNQWSRLKTENKLESGQPVQVASSIVLSTGFSPLPSDGRFRVESFAAYSATTIRVCCKNPLLNYISLHLSHAIVKILLSLHWVQASAMKLACSRRSDSGERCEVKRSAKK